MYKKAAFIINILVLILTFNAISRDIKLSNESKISLISYSSGKEIYAIFGHSAIRVYDPVNMIDYAFNYGTFDFSTPNFYLKFVRGNLEYFLTIADFKRSLSYYMSQNQSVNEIVLNLNQKEKQTLWNNLINNYKPENRYYKYDFFFDNCATRIRDIIVSSVNDTIYFTSNDTISNMSYRQLLTPDIKQNQWLDLGINLALGLPSDKIAYVRGSMYLPEYLQNGFKNSLIKTKTGEKPFITDNRMIFQATPEKTNNSFLNKLLSPKILFNILFLFSMLLTGYEIIKKTNYRWFDDFIFTITGILGVVFLFLWFGAEHRVMDNNLNVLWAMPLNIIFVLFIRHKKYRKVVRYYALTYSVLLIAIFLFWNHLPQQFHIYIIPLILTLIIRSVRIFLKP